VQRAAEQLDQRLDRTEKLGRPTWFVTRERYRGQAFEADGDANFITRLLVDHERLLETLGGPSWCSRRVEPAMSVNSRVTAPLATSATRLSGSRKLPREQVIALDGKLHHEVHIFLQDVALGDKLLSSGARAGAVVVAVAIALGQ
jgi:hypothetical protein